MNGYENDLLETAVDTASPAELTLLLYNGAVRFANRAIEEMEADHDEEAEEAIVKVGDIIMEFQTTLDRQYAISEPLFDLHQYMYRRLCLALTDKNESKSIVAEVRDMLREFRDTWKKAMQIAMV